MTRVFENKEYFLGSPRFLVVDIETTGLSPHSDTIVGIAYAQDETNGYYTTNLSSIAPALADEKIEKVFHNAVFDVSFLETYGYKVRGKIHDTMVLAHLHDPDRKSMGLKDLTKEIFQDTSYLRGYYAMTDWLSSNSLGKEAMHRAPQHILTAYAAEDACNTFSLFKHFCIKLREMRKWLNDRGIKVTPWEYYQEECIPMVPCVVAMQRTGVKINLELVAQRKLELTRRCNELKAAFPKDEFVSKAEKILTDKKIALRLAKNKSGVLKKAVKPVEFNWDSNDHLKILLFKVLKEKSIKETKSGNDSVDASVLESFADKYSWVKELLEYKELQKLLNTYLENLITLQQGGFIHANFHITGTATGRFSSSNPNLQNIPKHGDIKDLFIPRDGYGFIYADYSQLELRIAAHLSQDPLLLSAYRDGLDLHQLTADTIGVDRSLGKTVNFAIIYFASGWRIKDTLGLATVDEGDAVIKKLFAKYKTLAEWGEKQKQQMLKYGMSISEFGRIRRLTGLNSSDRKVFNHSLKAGFNQPIQSFGASLCKRAMIKLHEQGFRIVNQIHDSIIIEAPLHTIEKDLLVVKQTMENIHRLTVPLLVEPKILTSFKER